MTYVHNEVGKWKFLPVKKVMYLKEAYLDGFSFSSPTRLFCTFNQNRLFTFTVEDRSKMNTFLGSVLLSMITKSNLIIPQLHLPQIKFETIKFLKQGNFRNKQFQKTLGLCMGLI